jgi:uncharacterized protein with FMN-binding domain
MLSHAKEHESLTGKLLLSTALVAVTVGYGWWQYGQAAAQQAAMMAAMQAQMMATSSAQMQGSPSGSVANAAQAPAAQAAPAPDASTPAPTDMPVTNNNAAPAAPSNQMAMASPPSASPQSAAPAAQAMTQAPAAAAAAPTNGGLLPADAPKPPPPMPLTGMAAIQAFLPTEGVSPPLPPVSGTPDASANPPLPAGAHLADGDYTSDRIQFEWGDLRSRIVVTGGKVTTVQIVSYPDHRSQSLYLIQLADPILTTEVIKTQQAKVNTVSSATNSSIAFQDAIANAMMKATR